MITFITSLTCWFLIGFFSMYSAEKLDKHEGTVVYKGIPRKMIILFTFLGCVTLVYVIIFSWTPLFVDKCKNTSQSIGGWWSNNVTPWLEENVKF